MNIIKNTASNDPVLKRILALLKEQNKTQKNLIDFLGVHPNTFHQWKYSNSKGYMTRINDIASFLNVTPGYLLQGNVLSADIEGLTPREMEMIRILRKLNDEQQKAVLNCLKKFV
jgi:transcriptional regulator with XRE-family HTH domain